MAAMKAMKAKKAMKAMKAKKKKPEDDADDWLLMDPTSFHITFLLFRDWMCVIMCKFINLNFVMFCRKLCLGFGVSGSRHMCVFV